jgi:hypothetical protein
VDITKEHAAYCDVVKVKDKFVPVHTMKAYSRSRGITKINLNNASR